MMKEAQTEKKFLYKLTLDDINYLHGSNSGSLIGVFNSIKPGLKPFGQLIKNGGVTYSGEIDKGVASINQKAISVVPKKIPKRALEYSGLYNDGWMPTQGKKEVEFLTKYLLAVRKGKQVTKEFQQQNGLMDARTYEWLLRVLPQQLKVEKRKIANWEKLTNLEREFIEKPFPVVYGIKHKGDVVEVNSGILEEKGIENVIKPENLIVFVPNDKVDVVRKYIDDKNISVGNVLGGL